MKIFLGYPSERLGAAREVYALLHDALGHDVWFDKVSLIGADDWDVERARGQHEADFVVHVLSPEIFARAGVVNREINTTLKLIDDQPIGANYVLILRLEDFRLPAQLLRFQYLDKFEVGWEGKLKAAVQKRATQLQGGNAHTATPLGETIAAATPDDPASVSFTFTHELFSLEGNFLSYAGDGLYWSFVNAKLKSDALQSYSAVRGDFEETALESAEQIREWEHPYEWSLTMDEFYRKGEVVSVRSYTSIDFGGAHPNHYITTRNFFGEAFGLVSIQELLGHNVDGANQVIVYCQKVLEATFPDDVDEGTFESYLHSEENRWDLIGQFGVDAKGITINISPYKILPYDFGIHEILVPWHLVEEYLGERFKGWWQAL